MEETWQLRFESRDCERAGSCWLGLQVASCGMSSVLNSVMSSQRFRISPACGQVSPIVTSLCCPRNLTVVLLRSVRYWQNGCSSCIGSNSVRLAILCTLTHLPSLFSSSFRCLMVRCGDDPRMYFVQSRTFTRGTVDCTFVRADAWLDFSRDLVSLWSKTRQGQK